MPLAPQNSPREKKTLSIELVGFILLAATLIITRAIFFIRYNTQIIDTDQPYMWQGAKDYAKGIFMEPRYYGQSYNTYMEGLFAVPLLWLKVPVYYAVPLATHFISLFPPLFTGLYLYRHDKKPHALLVLAILLCLPSGYDFQNILPRGFVTGLFFCFYLVASVLYPNNLRALTMNSMLAVAGFFVNPNSLVVSLPVIIYAILHQPLTKKLFIYGGFVLLWAAILYMLFNGLYLIHPEYVIHPFDNSFSGTAFFESISNLDKRFAHISFFFNGKSFTVLLYILALGLTFFFKNKKAFGAFVGFIVLLMVSFLSFKTMEGSDWIFVSYSRMYLGIPVFLYLFSILLPMPRTLGILLCGPALCFSLVKLVNLDKSLEGQFANRGGVKLVSLQETKSMAQFYQTRCRENGAGFILVSSKFWLNTLVNAAGPSLYEDYPETMETWFEKRYWVREKNKNRILKKFILLASTYDFDKLIPHTSEFTITRIDNYGLFLIDNNRLKLGEFAAMVARVEPYQ